MEERSLLLVLLPILIAAVSSIAASELTEFSSGISNFASDFYQECVQSVSDNVIVSPYSVASALALLSQGTDGNSLEQIKSGLHVSGGKSEIAENYLQYHGLLERDAGNVSFSVANQIFVQQNIPLNKNFQEVATKNFFSGVESVDFLKPTEAASKINQFVAKKTNNKINELVSPDSLSTDSRVVLVNAIHMKAEWERKFEPHDTYKQDFYANEAENVSVDFMHATKSFNYGVLADLDATALEMKYLDSDLSLLILLPNSRTGLSTLETKLKSYDLSKVTDQLNEGYVKVSIPKFKIEHTVKLNDALKRMGISDIFDSGKANLSELLESKNALSISDVIHKAFIEVNEEGTEAAAATGVFAVLLSGSYIYPEPPQFCADHPFVYHIYDRKLKTPIFSGHVTRLE